MVVREKTISLKNAKGNTTFTKTFVSLFSFMYNTRICPHIPPIMIHIILISRQKVIAETSTFSLEEDIEMLSFDSRTESSSLPCSQVI